MYNSKMSKSTKHKSWVVINMEDGMWYWAEDQPNEEEAVKEYLFELFGDDEKAQDLNVQVIRAASFKDFYVKINEKPKFQIEEVVND